MNLSGIIVNMHLDIIVRFAVAGALAGGMLGALKQFNQSTPQKKLEMLEVATAYLGDEQFSELVDALLCLSKFKSYDPQSYMHIVRLCDQLAGVVIAVQGIEGSENLREQSRVKYGPIANYLNSNLRIHCQTMDRVLFLKPKGLYDDFKECEQKILTVADDLKFNILLDAS